MRLLPLLLLACPRPPSTDDGTDTDTDAPWTLGEVGGLSLLRTYDRGEPAGAELAAAFATTDQDFLNIAQCLARPAAPCVRALPEEVGSSIPWDPSDRFNPDPVQFRYVGLAIEFGPWDAFYEVTTTHSWYWNDLGDRAESEGPLGLELGVQWGDFREPDIATAAPPLALEAPGNGELVRVFSDEASFELRWEPNPGSDLFLFMREADASAPGRITRLEDDGSHVVDFSALGLLGDRDLIFQLARWTLDEVDVNGNQLRVQTTSDVTWFVRYIDVEGREPIVPVESCDDLLFVEKIESGRYYGDLSGNANRHAEAACLQSFLPANGRDGLVQVSVAPREELQVVYRQLAANAVMYAYESCDEPVCVLGEDRDAGQGPETLRVFNRSATTGRDYQLVLDASQPETGGLFFLDVTRTPVPEPQLADTCVEALQVPLLAPGRYYAGAPSGLFNRIDPGFTGCTGTSLPGPDAIARVLVPPGATLEVTVSMEGGGDPGLYLLPICNDATSCVLGSDTPGSGESLVYTNSGAAAQQLHLVVDTRTTMNPFFLTVRVQ